MITTQSHQRRTAARVKFLDSMGQYGELLLENVRPGDLVKFEEDYTVEAPDEWDDTTRKVFSGETGEVIDVLRDVPGLLVEVPMELSGLDGKIFGEGELLVPPDALVVLRNTADPTIGTHRMGRRWAALIRQAALTQQAWAPLITLAMDAMERQFPGSSEYSPERKRHVLWALKSLADGLHGVLPLDEIDWDDNDTEFEELASELEIIASAIERVPDRDWKDQLKLLRSVADDELAAEVRPNQEDLTGYGAGTYDPMLEDLLEAVKVEAPPAPPAQLGLFGAPAPVAPAPAPAPLAPPEESLGEASGEDGSLVITPEDVEPLQRQRFDLFRERQDKAQQERAEQLRAENEELRIREQQRLEGRWRTLLGEEERLRKEIEVILSEEPEPGKKERRQQLREQRRETDKLVRQVYQIREQILQGKPESLQLHNMPEVATPPDPGPEPKPEPVGVPDRPAADKPSARPIQVSVEEAARDPHEWATRKDMPARIPIGLMPGARGRDKDYNRVMVWAQEDLIVERNGQKGLIIGLPRASGGTDFLVAPIDAEGQQTGDAPQRWPASETRLSADHDENYVQTSTLNPKERAQWRQQERSHESQPNRQEEPGKGKEGDIRAS